MRSSILSGVQSGSLVLLLALSLPARCDVVVASEFFHKGMGHYFVTAFAGEEAALDAHPSWARTATQYRVHDAPGPGLVPVCRFFSASFAPLSSHFYTADAAECEIVKRNPSWTYEGIAFFVQSAAADRTCAAGSGPVYRLYNNGLTGAPNHRYTPWSAERAHFIARGWTAEGAGPLGMAFCVPVEPDANGERLQDIASKRWMFGWPADAIQTIVTLDFGPVVPSLEPESPWELRIASAGGGTGRWDPYLGQVVVMVWPFIARLARLAFEVREGEVAGCAYLEREREGFQFLPPPGVLRTYQPCQALVGLPS